MSYELNAILHYDSCRLNEKYLTKKICETLSKCSNISYFSPFFSETCLYKQAAYRKWERLPDYDISHEEPEWCQLCEQCIETEKLIQARKVIRKEFGIAKTRLSRIARDYRNSFVIEVQS